MKHDAFCLDAVRFSKRRSLVVLLLSVHLGLFALSSAVGQSLTWLGTLGGNESQAYGISADSRVVVGTAQDASNVRRGFRWTRETGMQNLGNSTTAAHGVSADGSVVVGWHLDSLGRRFAFLWNLQHGARWLNIGGFSQTWANAVSADGAVVHGSAIFGSSNFPARWRSPNWVIEYMSGRTGTTWATSADGSVIVGGAYFGSNYRAFRWENDQIQNLGTLGGNASEARSVSPDGTVVVGGSTTPLFERRAFRWTASEGMRDLGTLPDLYLCDAHGVSADGSVVVGASKDVSNPLRARAFRWTAQTGMQNLNDLYAHLLPSNAYLAVAYAISPDGRYIVGWGWKGGRFEAYLLDTRRDSTVQGRIDLRDFGGDITGVPVHVELRQGGGVVRSLQVTTDANGKYLIADVADGTYDIAFKASRWLRVVVTGVAVAGADVTGVDVSLTNGDIDGDNEVSLFDFGALVAAFGSAPGDPEWNANADLDGDEDVSLFDFGVLVRNFGAIGDE